MSLGRSLRIWLDHGNEYLYLTTLELQIIKYMVGLLVSFTALKLSVMLPLNMCIDNRKRLAHEGRSGNGYSRKEQKQSQKRPNQARDGKDKVKSRPKSVKVKKSTGKSTPSKSKDSQVEKIQLEGLKLSNLKLYYENKRQGLKLHS
ncbi:hypothetical protein Tco_1096744, partial [Tanacetum coccineum]